jgi:hypothetical protein
MTSDWHAGPVMAQSPSASSTAIPYVDGGAASGAATTTAQPQDSSSDAQTAPKGKVAYFRVLRKLSVV